MSKRFGRQQKRKLKEELERAHGYVARRDDDIAHMQKTIWQQREVIDMTAEVLGDHFCTLPPKGIAGSVQRELMLHKPFRNSPLALNDLSATVDLSDALISLDTYSADLKTDQLSGAMHVRVLSSDGGMWGYALSPDAKRSAPKEYWIKTISSELAQMIVNEWRDDRAAAEIGRGMK